MNRRSFFALLFAPLVARLIPRRRRKQRGCYCGHSAYAHMLESRLGDPQTSQHYCAACKRVCEAQRLPNWKGAIFMGRCELGRYELVEVSRMPDDTYDLSYVFTPESPAAD